MEAKLSLGQDDGNKAIFCFEVVRHQSIDLLMISKNHKTKLAHTWKIGSYYVKILSVSSVASENVDQLIPKFRGFSPNVKVQGIDSAVVFGRIHVLRVLQLTMELWNRGIRIAKTIETDLLMRLCCTDQISKAIELGGLKKGQPAYFILISEDLNSLFGIEQLIRSSCADARYSVLRIEKKKMRQFYDKYGICGNKIDRTFLENILVERAALVQL
jgi:tRNA threonylcarbamoyladenosine modification (KEOPS) complex Cgi121 subunit